MKPVQLALELKRIVAAGRFAYIKCEPEVLDFTSHSFQGYLVIHPKQGEPLKVPLHKENLIPYLGILSAAIFEDKDFVVLAWNVKNLFSLVRFHTKSLIAYDCKLIDLKLLEAFLGIRNKPAPDSFASAAERVKTVSADDSYSKAKVIYQKVHVPLFSEVIPSIETNGLYNKETRTALYPYYEIEGQVNGRMKCHEVYDKCFIPHTMGPQDRELLRPRGVDEVFVYFDYRNMEVSMLQWLAQDDRLAQILGLEEDFYKVLFKLIAGVPCDTDAKRDMSKNLFLPVIYGMQANTLAQEFNVSVATADKIINRIYKLFPKSIGWIQQEFDGVCYDHFGRKRYFEEGIYKARNYLVQAPASVVCLEKLIKLFSALKGYAKVVCHIHDGYVVTCGRAAVKVVASIGKDALESDSELCSGMRLRSSIKTGNTLAELSELNQ